MERFSLQTPEEISSTLAARVRALRLAKGWKQATLAERSGVSLGSLRRFESSGQVSLGHLLRIAFALNRLDDFDTLLQAPRASSIAELEAAEKQPTRRRGRA
jgi:transcriptional regulator with XRE-family HTH domain